jgi:cAMP-specific phosphodiesterase 4
MIQMVLATDNAMHTEYLVTFGNKIDDDECDFDQWEDQILVLQIALHAADVANPAKPRQIYKQWIERVMAEFYGQGDKEREEGMPVTPFLDRTKPIPEERFQSGFIKAIVQPLYIAFSRVDGFDMRVPLTTLKTNLQWYQDIIDGQ